MSRFDPDYLYLPHDYQGHRPANRRTVQEFENGTVYAVPAETTMHIDLVKLLRRTKDEAWADAAKQGAGAEVRLRS